MTEMEPGDRYGDGDGGTWEAREDGIPVKVEQYVVSIEDGETKVFPYAGISIIDVPEDKIDLLYSMADIGATLAQIAEQFGDVYSPTQEA